MFTLGHSRTRGRGKIFPFTRTDEPIDTEHKRLNPNMALYKLEKPYLDGKFASMIGNDVTIRDIGCEIDGTVTARYYKGLGANGDNAVIQTAVEYDRKEGIGEEIEIAHTLNSTDRRGLNRNQKQNAVVVSNEIKQIGNIDQWKRNRDNQQTGRIYDIDGISPCLTTMQGGGLEPKVAIPCLTPDRIEKRQNGRRFKEDGEPMFTLTAQDRHGVMIKEATKKGYDIAEEGDSINLEHPDSETRRGRVGKGVANTLTTSCNQGVVEPNFRIRRLTPLECWRLQGVPDEYFYRAKNSGVSDSQLYKQAGNACTTNVIYEIAKRL